MARKFLGAPCIGHESRGEVAMAVREFTDGRGRRWRAWDVTPEELQPVTRAEAVMLGYEDGWLTFETTDGEVRKRLPVYPPDWSSLPVEGLEQLLQQAELVRVEGRGAERSGEREEVDAASRASDIPPARPASDVIRTFAYPGGRVWSAWEQHLTPVGGDPSSPRQPRKMLRFTSGTRTLYLHRWPEDWASYTDSQLADLLWRSMPREPQTQQATQHRRRRGDIEPRARGDIEAEPPR